MHQRRGVQAEAGAEGRGRAAHTERRAAERRHSIADGTAEMHLGEEVAATLRAPGISLGLFFYVCI